MKNSPCNHCPLRFVGCHSYCKEYKDWKNEVAAFRAAHRMYYAGQQAADAHTKDTIAKNLKRLPTKRKVGQR